MVVSSLVLGIDCHRQRLDGTKVERRHLLRVKRFALQTARGRNCRRQYTM